MVIGPPTISRMWDYCFVVAQSGWLFWLHPVVTKWLYHTSTGHVVMYLLGSRSMQGMFGASVSELYLLIKSLIIIKIQSVYIGTVS